MTGYSNFDYVLYVDTRRSVIGYMFTIGSSVGSCKSTLQSSVMCTIKLDI